MVRTSRCGRDNPGSIPGGDKFHAAASDEQRSSTLLDFPDFHVQAAVQMCPPLFQVAPQATIGWQLGGNQVGPGGNLEPGGRQAEPADTQVTPIGNRTHWR